MPVRMPYILLVRAALSAYGPSLQILRWKLMSAFGELRTSRQAPTQRIETFVVTSGMLV
jgi:hypothetical protein